jgi:hypothetical protein
VSRVVNGGSLRLALLVPLASFLRFPGALISNLFVLLRHDLNDTTKNNANKKRNQP